MHNNYRKCIVFSIYKMFKMTAISNIIAYTIFRGCVHIFAKYCCQYLQPPVWFETFALEL